MVGMSRRLLIVGALVVGFVVWSFLGFASVVYGGNHVCALLQPVGPDNTPWPTNLTNEQWAEITRQRCGDPVPYMQVVIFGAGYVVMGAVAVRSLRSR
jgi:hypothetical protein